MGGPAYSQSAYASWQLLVHELSRTPNPTTNPRTDPEPSYTEAPRLWEHKLFLAEKGQLRVFSGAFSPCCLAQPGDQARERCAAPELDPRLKGPAEGDGLGVSPLLHLPPPPTVTEATAPHPRKELRKTCGLKEIPVHDGLQARGSEGLNL